MPKTWNSFENASFWPKFSFRMKNTSTDPNGNQLRKKIDHFAHFKTLENSGLPGEGGPPLRPNEGFERGCSCSRYRIIGKPRAKHSLIADAHEAKMISKLMLLTNICRACAHPMRMVAVNPLHRRWCHKPSKKPLWKHSKSSWKRLPGDTFILLRLW